MSNFLKKLFIISALVLSLFIYPYTYCMLNNIADTDTILHNDYQYLSLANGAIAWETGVIRRLYDFGQIFPVYRQDKQGRKIIENYEYPEQTHKTVRLIHALFYRVPGSTGETDFGVTIQLAKDKPEDVIALIVRILVQCKQLRQQGNQFQQTIDFAQKLIRTFTQENLEKLGKKTNRTMLENKIKKAQKNIWNKQEAEAFLSLYKSIAKNLAIDLDKQIVEELHKNQRIVEEFFSILFGDKKNVGITQNLRDLFKPEVFKKRENIDAIMWQALYESDPNNVDMIYLPYMVETIFLAFIYKKYSDNRTVLKAFYNELNIQLNGKLLVRELDETWVKSSFASVTQTQAYEQVERILSGQDTMQSINKNFALFTYNIFQVRSFPMPVGYESIRYEYEKGKKTEPVADCMDNTMRNFINAYAYDAEQNIFSLKKLLTSFNISTVDATLRDFLKFFSDVNKASSMQAHSVWLQLISNIPYVAYNRMVDATTQQSTIATGKGYVTLPDNEQDETLVRWMQDNSYQIIEKNQYCYELQPSVKNIIIVLDHVLQLNLFVQNGGLVKEFMRSDFIKEYFPKLCQAITMTGFLSTQKDADRSELSVDFDLLDYTNTKVYTTLKQEKITCILSTYNGHGDLSLITAENIKLGSLVQHINNFEKQPIISFIVSNILSKQLLSFTHLKNNLNYIYSNLFAMPLENSNLLIHIVRLTFSIEKINTLPLKIRVDMKDLFMRLAVRQPDAIVRQGIQIYINASLIRTMNEDDIKEASDIVHDAIMSAKEGALSHSGAMQTRAFNLFKVLFEKNQGFAQALEVAIKNMSDQDYHVRFQALMLLIELVEKGQTFKEIVQLALQSIVDENREVKLKTFELFMALVKRDYGFKEALEAAMKTILDKDGGVRKQALALLIVLIEKNQGIKEIIDFAVTSMKKKSPIIKRIALNVFIVLVTNNHGFKEAMDAAKKGVIQIDGDVRRNALKLFKVLIGKLPHETKEEIKNMLHDAKIVLAEDVKESFNNLLSQ